MIIFIIIENIYSKKDILSFNFLLHDTLCDKYNQIENKDSIIRRKERRSNIIECDYCKKRFIEDYIVKHKKNCKHKPIYCRYCSLLIDYNIKNNHEIYCGSRTIKCETCKTIILKKEIDYHQKFNCA